jgi:hypothetical protein
MALVLANGCSLNGSSQYFRRTFVSNVVDNFTIAFWVKVISFQGATTYLFQNGQNGGDGYTIYVSSLGVVGLDISFVANYNSGASIAAGGWNHIAVVRNSGTLQFYINGVATPSSSASTPNAPSVQTTVGAQCNGAGTATGFCSCMIDDLRDYERALSVAEILQLVNRASNPNIADISATSLKAWWKFDESSGNAVDSSGNALTLTNNGTATYAVGIAATAKVPSTALLGIG